MFKNKNVLVAGGAGFVGVNLIKALLERGANITATLHKKPAVINDNKIKYIKCELTNEDDCKRVMKGIDYVFMCAANTSGAAVMANTPLVHVTPNVIMNTLTLEAAYDAKVEKFLWFSSNTVYPPFEHPVKEEEMMCGEVFDKYFCVAWMKRFTEILCQMYANKIKNPMKVIVVRPANIYGPYDDFEWETSHVVPALIRKVVERHDPVEVWGDGNDIKDLIYIDDFVEGTLLAMEKIDTYDPINIGTGQPCSVKDVLNAILKADGYTNARISFNSSKPSMIPKRLIDVTKAKRLLGFEAKTSLEKGMAKTAQWYRENRIS
ncbi:NAD-dependent epimerase/dehydratase family protein [bacterium]|nr:NAD-dependent epimerase/dehydratase family protein [bacterium]